MPSGYRKTNKFKSIKGFKNVNGACYKTYESLKRYIGQQKNTPIVKQKASKKIKEAKDAINDKASKAKNLPKKTEQIKDEAASAVSQTTQDNVKAKKTKNTVKSAKEKPRRRAI